MFGKPTREESDAIARKHGWITTTDHPPFPFLAIVATTPEELLNCDDTGEYEEQYIPDRKWYRMVRLIRDIDLDEKFAPFGGGCYFAKPYRGPCFIAYPINNGTPVVGAQYTAPILLQTNTHP